ncbi:MAG: fibronectin type III domain-containing protein [Candidatus Diapherotrites archaeon]|uniref:Fibronectin type III domain-containing protein n=1 Tax=Candidatus Iainarchaeum sp. TaxID=3101447 RepID=A0A8T4L896_9ARCH|nr:MAG: fibronectin type III protein [archaeon GW2011_AR10]MBS3059156.1 fibronectin type III domain-containing protein [Candidatus Diapherotrites archaeon]
MSHAKLFLCLFLLFGVLQVSAAVPSVSVVSPSADGNYLKGTAGIVFTVLDSDAPADINANIYYSSSAGAHTNAVQLNYALNASSCDGTDFTSTRTCSYSWNTTGAADGNYFIDVNVVTSIDSAEDSSDNDFRVDNTAPSTSSDVNSGTWQKFDFTITLTCTDSGGCSSTAYRVDSGAWSTGNSVSITTDGNHQVDFNSTDLARNVESTKTVYALRDTTIPTISISSPANGSTTSGNTVAFDLNDALGAVNLSSIAVDINGTASTAFSSSSCSDVNGQAHCSYTETKFDTNSADYNVAVRASDKAGNKAAQAQSLFKYLDSAAPSQVTGFTSASGNGQIQLSWTANSATDLNHYNVYMSTSSGFATDGNTLIAVVAAGTNSYTKTGLSNGTTYYFKVSAEDKTGNEGADSDQINAAPTAGGSGLSSPSISSSTHTHDSWSTNNLPSFSWGSVSGADNYSYEFNQSSDSTPDTSSDTSGTSYSPGTKDDGIWYFHVRACASGSCGSTSHFTVKIDTTGPEQVTDLTINANADGTMDLEWDSASDRPSGNNSGVKEYWVYRDNENDFSVSNTKRVGITSSSNFTDDGSDLIKDVRYYYKVRAVDNAGNSGQISAEVSAQASKTGACDFDVSFSFDEFVGSGKITVGASSNSSMSDIVFRLRVPGIGYLKEESIDSSSRSVTATYDVNSNFDGKTAEFSLSAKDNSGNECFFRATPKIDGKAPSVDWLSPLEEAELDLSREQSLEVSVTDEGSGVKEVEFFYDSGSGFVSLGKDSSGVSGKYSIETSSIQAGENGLKLKAVATDNAGNEAEAEIQTSVERASIVVLTSNQKEYGSQSFNYSDADIPTLLADAGLQDSLIEEAEALFNENTVERNLVVLEENGTFTASVILIVRNNSAETLDLQVVEVIPKEFAQKASDIESSRSFDVLNSDPVIKFLLEGIEPDETILITYQLKGSFSQAKADSILSSSMTEKFAAPPIVLGADSELGDSFKEETSLSGFLALIALIIVLLVAIIVLLAVLGGGLFLHQRKRQGFGATTALHYRRDDMFGKLKKALEGQEVIGPKRGKFAWKGK